jgi:hypothetical protein
MSHISLFLLAMFDKKPYDLFREILLTVNFPALAPGTPSNRILWHLPLMCGARLALFFTDGDDP